MKCKALIGPRVSLLAKLGSTIASNVDLFQNPHSSSVSTQNHPRVTVIMLSLTRAAGSRIQCPGVATNVLRRHGTFPSPRDFLHLRAPQFSTTTSRFAYKKRPPTLLESWIRDKEQKLENRLDELRHYKKRPPTLLGKWLRDKEQKLEDKLNEVRQRQLDYGVSEEQINKQDQVAEALAAATMTIALAAGVYYLYSAWMGPAKEKNDWIITLHEGSAVEVKKPGVD
jgi:hypothetical protein